MSFRVVSSEVHPSTIWSFQVGEEVPMPTLHVSVINTEESCTNLHVVPSHLTIALSVEEAIFWIAFECTSSIAELTFVAVSQDIVLLYDT